jgi:hypothetical protein
LAASYFSAPRWTFGPASIDESDRLWRQELAGKRALIPPAFGRQQAAGTWIIQGDGVKQASITTSRNVDQRGDIDHELVEIGGCKPHLASGDKHENPDDC